MMPGTAIVQNLVMFTVGTGIGGGLVLGGRVYRGATGAAGELGHTLIGADLSQEAPTSGGSRGAGRSSRWPPGGSWTGWRGRWRSFTPNRRWAASRPPPEAVDGHDAVEAPGGRRRPSGRSARSASASGSGSPTRSTRSTRTSWPSAGAIGRRGAAARPGPRDGDALRIARGRGEDRDPAGPTREPRWSPRGGAARRPRARRSGRDHPSTRTDGWGMSAVSAPENPF